MTAGQSTRHLSNVSLAPAPLAALLAATLMAGAMIGAGITQLGSTGSSAALNGAAAQPAGFRTDDRALDGAGFRNDSALDGAGFRTDDRALDGAGFRTEAR